MHPIQDYIVKLLQSDWSEFSEDPIILTMIPLSESSTFNSGKCDDLYDQYMQAGFLRFDEDKGTSLWIGPDKISYKGRQTGFLKVIFSSICTIGIPRDYTPVTHGEDKNDITPGNLYLQEYDGTREIPYNEELYPFVNPNTPRKFGTLSPTQMWDRMNNVVDSDPIIRWECVNDLSKYVRYVSGVGGRIDYAIGPGDDETVKYPMIKHRVRDNKGTSDQYPCWLFNREGGMAINTLNLPVRVMPDDQDDYKIVRLHHLMWKLVFGFIPSERKGELSACPNRWCINPFHYQFNKK